MTSVKALFLDVDGTLYSHRLPGIPDSALRTLQLLHERGVLIFLSTGRHRLSLERLDLRGFPFDGYVTVTGHLCYDASWNPVYRLPFSPEDTAVLAEAFRSRRLPMLLLEEHRQFVNRLDDPVLSVVSGVSAGSPDAGAYDGGPVYAAAVYCPLEEALELERCLPGCRLSTWHPGGHDIISLESGKVRGMEELMRLHHLKREEIAAFGDADNDVEMLSFAGLGIAMGNGTEKARAAADWVTSSAEDGGLEEACRHFGWI